MNIKILLIILAFIFGIYFFMNKNIDCLLLTILIIIILFFINKNNGGVEFFDDPQKQIALESIQNLASVYNNGILKVDNIECKTMKSLGKINVEGINVGTGNNINVAIDADGSIDIKNRGFLKCKKIELEEGIDAKIYGKFGNIDIQGDNNNIVGKGNRMGLISEKGELLIKTNDGPIDITASKDKKTFLQFGKDDGLTWFRGNDRRYFETKSLNQ